MPGLAGWKPFRRQARQFLSRMNLAKKQNSEGNKMKEKTDDEPSHPLVEFCTEEVFLILKETLPKA